MHCGKPTVSSKPPSARIPTQSALSHQFAELEERLGLQLFVRKTRPVRFTSAGLRLLQLADLMLPQLRSAERDLARLAGGTAGRLHMAIECHSCFQWLMPTIDQFRDAWPEVELTWRPDFPSRALPAPGPRRSRPGGDLRPAGAAGHHLCAIVHLRGVARGGQPAPAGRAAVRTARGSGQRDADHLSGRAGSPGYLHPLPRTGRYRTRAGAHLGAHRDDDAAGRIGARVCCSPNWPCTSTARAATSPPSVSATRACSPRFMPAFAQTCSIRRSCATSC